MRLEDGKQIDYIDLPIKMRAQLFGLSGYKGNCGKCDKRSYD